MKSKRGFTLIELLVVISIIGLLSSVVLASLNTSKSKAIDAKVTLTVRQFKTALLTYFIDHNYYPLVPISANHCLGPSCIFLGDPSSKQTLPEEDGLNLFNLVDSNTVTVSIFIGAPQTKGITFTCDSIQNGQCILYNIYWPLLTSTDCKPGNPSITFADKGVICTITLNLASI